MICFGVCDAVASIFVGFIGKYTGRPPLFVFATVLNLGILGLMRFWSFRGEVPFIMFFVIPGVWGLADAVWQTQSGGILIYLIYLLFLMFCFFMNILDIIILHKIKT